MRLIHLPDSGMRRLGRRNGWFMVEMLVYLGLVALIGGLALASFYRALDNSRDLTRNANDIARTLRAGERWREDVRLASGALRLVAEPPLSGVEIPHATGQVAYIFDGTNVWRRAGEEPADLFLAGVRASVMQRDQRTRLASWRWEVELSTKKRAVRLRPLFTFQTVAPGGIP